jgi:hypothetical protein
MTASPLTDPEVVLETLETIWQGEAILDKANDLAQHVEPRLCQAQGTDQGNHERPSYGPVTGPGQPRL